MQQELLRKATLQPKRKLSSGNLWNCGLGARGDGDARTPQKVWFFKNPGKIPENQENVGTDISTLLFSLRYEWDWLSTYVWIWTFFSKKQNQHTKTFLRVTQKTYCWCVSSKRRSHKSFGHVSPNSSKTFAVPTPMMWNAELGVWLTCKTVEKHKVLLDFKRTASCVVQFSAWFSKCRK